jgi:hypothetical protein
VGNGAAAGFYGFLTSNTSPSTKIFGDFPEINGTILRHGRK